MRPRVLLYVQHLLGIGHLRRGARIAAALAARGLDCALVSGGAPSPGLNPGGARLLQLPPLRAGAGGFGDLVHPGGAQFTEADRDARRDALLAILARERPDALILEAYPFGRRQMRFELAPLLEAAAARRPRPFVAASVRDIAQARAPERDAESAALARRHFDAVLVHGDPRLVAFGESFGRAADIADLVTHTGLVAPPPRQAGPREGVIVTAGGGAVGAPLLRAALRARPLCRLRDRPWLIVAGPHADDGAFAELAAGAGPGVEVRRSIDDLDARIAGAELVVSQAGYNSVAEILRGGARAVLVPYAAGGETEQSLRARRLAEIGRAETVTENTLSPGSLAAAIDRTRAAPSPAFAIDLDGAGRTADIIAAKLGLPPIPRRS